MSFKFRYIDEQAATKPHSGLWGTLGFSERYQGTLADSDPLVQSIRASMDREKLTPDQQLLLRSFCGAWLNGNEKRLGSVVAYAVQLPRSVQYITRIGWLGRTVNQLTAGVVGVAGLALSLDATWDMVFTDFSALSSGELAKQIMISPMADVAVEALLPAPVYSNIERTFGKPGSPLNRSDFQSDVIFDLIKVIRFRPIVECLVLADDLRESFLERLEQRTWALFLATSRQLEGLMLSGASEASAAVVGHAAIALGLSGTDTRCVWHQIEKSIQKVKHNERRIEASATFAGIQENLKKDHREIERKISRHLVSNSATETMDLVTYPISLTLDLFGSVAGGLGKLAGKNQAATALQSARDGFKSAAKAVDATPDAASKVIGGGITAESWTRDVVRKALPWNRGKEER